MRKTEELLQLLVDYLEGKGKGSCVCDVLDRVYWLGHISLNELNYLYDYILHNIASEIIDDAIKSGNEELFVLELKKRIEALQGNL